LQILIPNNDASAQTINEGFFALHISPNQSPLIKNFQGKILCLIPLPSRTYATCITLESATKSLQNPPIVYTFLDHCYIDIPTFFTQNDFTLRVSYQSCKLPPCNPQEDRSRSCYAAYSLPEELLKPIKDHIFQYSDPLEQLQKLEKWIQKMTYDLSEETRILYQDKTGVDLIKAILEHRKGCCFEFAQLYACLASKLLGVEIRIAYGWKHRSSTTFAGHTWVEAKHHNHWIRFDPTPKGNRSKQSSETLPSLEPFKGVNYCLSMNYSEVSIKRKALQLLQWCLNNDYVKKNVTVKVLPCQSHQGHLNIGMAHYCNVPIYHHYQLQTDDYQPFLKVIFYLEDLRSATNVLLLLAHFKLKIPVFIAIKK